MFLCLYPYEGVLDRYVQVITTYLHQCLANANAEARSIGRKAFLIWQQLNQEQANNLFGTLDYAVQKAICEDADQFEILKTNSQGLQKP